MMPCVASTTTTRGGALGATLPVPGQPAVGLTWCGLDLILVFIFWVSPAFFAIVAMHVAVAMAMAMELAGIVVITTTTTIVVICVVDSRASRALQGSASRLYTPPLSLSLLPQSSPLVMRRPVRVHHRVAAQAIADGAPQLWPLCSAAARCACNTSFALQLLCLAQDLCCKLVNRVVKHAHRCWSRRHWLAAVGAAGLKAVAGTPPQPLGKALLAKAVGTRQGMCHDNKVLTDPARPFISQLPKPTRC